MKKPIGNFYTVIWVDVPDAPQTPARRGTGAPGAAGLTRLRDVKARVSRFWQGPRWAGALSGAAALLALVFHRG